jgi:riboflavin kinase/FMN adenylyltransferase
MNSQIAMISEKFSGTAQKHLGRGTKLGFPTANMDVPSQAQEGTFLGWTTLGGKKWPSLIFIGAPETFGETDKRAETYILDFRGSLYGKSIEIELIEKLRDNKKFGSEAELVEQMKADEQKARIFFARK